MLTNPSISISSIINCYNSKYQNVNSILIIEALLKLQRLAGNGQSFEAPEEDLFEMSGISGTVSTINRITTKLRKDNILLLEKGQPLANGRRSPNSYTFNYDKLNSDPESLWDTYFKTGDFLSIGEIGAVINCYNDRYRDSNSIRVIEYLMQLQSINDQIYNESRQDLILNLSGITGSIGKISRVLKKLEEDRIVSIRRRKRRLRTSMENDGIIINKINQYTVNYKNLANSPELLWDLDKVDATALSQEYLRLLDEYGGGNFTTQGLNGRSI